MLGYAWQCGLLPLTRQSVMQAIEANGAAVDMNRRAFEWGRIAAAQPDELQRALSGVMAAPSPPKSLDALVEHLRQELVAYQGPAYAARFSALVETARGAERKLPTAREAFSRAVAESAFRLMAYKDEYEVARLYAAREFRESLGVEFARAQKVSLWLAPPLFSRKDPTTGRPKKRRFGPWIFPAMKLVAAMRVLRGTPFDLFGYTDERRAERALIEQFADDARVLSANLTDANFDRALALATAPQEVRGYGSVKHAAIDIYNARRLELLQSFKNSAAASREG
jgi:indolepyruvate ferredoxin oxidoreductase